MEEEREGVTWAPKANPRHHQMGGTWAPKANPRAMEVVGEGVTWAPKANPRQSGAAEMPVKEALVETKGGSVPPRPAG